MVHQGFAEINCSETPADEKPVENKKKENTKQEKRTSESNKAKHGEPSHKDKSNHNEDKTKMKEKHIQMLEKMKSMSKINRTEILGNIEKMLDKMSKDSHSEMDNMSHGEPLYNEVLNPRQVDYPNVLGFNDLHIHANIHLDVEKSIVQQNIFYKQ